MKHFFSRIYSNIVLCEDLYEMVFSWNEEVQLPLPGQFCTIHVAQSTSPLLRRPFAFSGFDPLEKTASIVFKKVGVSTEILAGKQCGDVVDIIGPLGNSFLAYPQRQRNILVAGGTGLGPIFFWKRFLQQQKASSLMVAGYSSKSLVPDIEEFDDETVVICTDDGSQGFRGTVVDYLRTLPDDFFQDTTLYCCGPWGMLKACNDFALDQGSECYVSLEQIMACGVGACMGCAVKIIGESSFARVCIEGPVFNSKVIAWT
jgi:dihydroorotate dehydrogenase electron transfer subunit